MRSAPDPNPLARDARLPGWQVSLLPEGPVRAWWGMVLEGHTQKSTHRSVSRDDDAPGAQPLRRRRTTTTYTLRTVALPEPPTPGSGVAGVRRGRRCEISLAYATGDTTAGDGSDAPAGRVGAAGMTWWVDGTPVELMVQAADATWRQTGTASWRACGALALAVASGTAEVSLEVTAFDVDEVFERWTTVPVDTLINRRAAWLADVSSRP